MCSQTHWLHHFFMGTMVFSPNQIGACRCGSGVKDLSGGWSHSHPLHWWMGDSSQKDRVWRHHYQRGFPPLSIHEVKETLGCRLMTVCRQAGFGSDGALFTTRKPLCLTKFQLFHSQLCRDEILKFTTGIAECKCVVPLFLLNWIMSVNLPLQGFCGLVWCFKFYLDSSHIINEARHSCLKNTVHKFRSVVHVNAF